MKKLLFLALILLSVSGNALAIFGRCGACPRVERVRACPSGVRCTSEFSEGEKPECVRYVPEYVEPDCHIETIKTYSCPPGFTEVQ